MDEKGPLSVFFSCWQVAPLGPNVNLVSSMTGFSWPEPRRAALAWCQNTVACRRMGFPSTATMMLMASWSGAMTLTHAAAISGPRQNSPTASITTTCRPTNFEAIATQYGVSVKALTEALGNGCPPNSAAAAKLLGISEEDLRQAMPAPNQESQTPNTIASEPWTGSLCPVWSLCKCLIASEDPRKLCHMWIAKPTAPLLAFDARLTPQMPRRIWLRVAPAAEFVTRIGGDGIIPSVRQSLQSHPRVANFCAFLR